MKYEISNVIKAHRVMYRLTALNYRNRLKDHVEHIESYNDRQVFELAHAFNTGVDLRLLSNPLFSSTKMKKIRLDKEFSKNLANCSSYEQDDVIIIR